jgi:hypothetical protein
VIAENFNWSVRFWIETVRFTLSTKGIKKFRPGLRILRYFPNMVTTPTVAWSTVVKLQLSIQRTNMTAIPEPSQVMRLERVLADMGTVLTSSVSKVRAPDKSNPIPRKNCVHFIVSPFRRAASCLTLSGALPHLRAVLKHSRGPQVVPSTCGPGFSMSK